MSAPCRRLCHLISRTSRAPSTSAASASCACRHYSTSCAGTDLSFRNSRVGSNPCRCWLFTSFSGGRRRIWIIGPACCRRYCSRCLTHSIILLPLANVSYSSLLLLRVSLEGLKVQKNAERCHYLQAIILLLLLLWQMGQVVSDASKKFHCVI